MKQTIPYINIVTLSLIFVGCTPAPTPPSPTKVFENRPIKASSSTPSLGRAIHSIPITSETITTSVVREPTQTTKAPTEVITPVYQEVVKEDSIQEETEMLDDAQIEEILTTEESTESIPEELVMETLPPEDTTQSSKTPSPQIAVNPYGNPPKNYRTSIRTYLAKKANPSDTLKYVFSRPEKAEKKDKSWKGWMVKVDMLKRNGKGEILKNQPYTILFNGSSILEDFASDNPKNITKVVY